MISNDDRQFLRWLGEALVELSTVQPGSAKEDLLLEEIAAGLMPIGAFLEAWLWILRTPPHREIEINQIRALAAKIDERRRVLFEIRGRSDEEVTGTEPPK